RPFAPGEAHRWRPAKRRPYRRRHAIGGLLAEGLGVRLLPSGAPIVNSTADTTAAGTLRWAIRQAQTLGGDEAIAFDPGVFATPQTIALSTELPHLTDTTGTVLIDGPTASYLTVARSAAAGTPTFRIFTVDSGVKAVVSGLTFAGGNDG